MDVAASLAQHLQALAEDPYRDYPDGDRSGRGEQLAAPLKKLSAELAAAVPSLLAVSIVLGRLNMEVTVSAAAHPADTSAVLASLAVPLSGAAPADLLMVRAAEPGAFLLLADDLTARLGPHSPAVELDNHLSMPPVLTPESLAASLADLREVNQGLGVLIEQGLPPEAARAELQRRARDLGTTLGGAGRVLLASLAPPPEGC